MKTWQNLIKVTKESKLDQTFYNFSKNISETDKFEKVLNSRKVYWNNFLTYQRLILMYYFHQRILKGKTTILENILLIFFHFLWYHDLSIYKKACLHNLCMNRVSLDSESLNRVSWTSTTLCVVLVSPIKKQQLTNWTASHMVGTIRLLFDLISLL